MEITFGPYRLKRQERVLVGPEGVVELSARSFDILCALLEKPGEVIGKDELFAAVWPGVVVEENTLQVHVSALRKALAPGSIVTVHGRGYKFASPLLAGRASNPVAGPPLEDRKPIVAVLPFANLSGDPEQQFFSDGITEDIIDRLSRFRLIDVIGWHSAFALHGADQNFREIRNRLHADYVVTGNVKRAAGRIRIAARLSDTRHETVIWAERYDCVLDDIFDIQDEVSVIIVSMLNRHVEVDVATRTRPRNDLTSYELVLKGMMHCRMQPVVGLDAAAGYFRRALEINPGSAEAMRGLANYHLDRWIIDYQPADLAAALDYGKRGTELDPTSAVGLVSLGLAQMAAHGVDEAKAAFRRALEINPGDSHVLADGGLHAIYDGRLEEAHALLKRAVRLNPIPPFWFVDYRALLDFAEGRFADAARAFGRVDGGKFRMTYTLASLALAGGGPELAPALALVRKLGWDLNEVVDAEPYRDPEMRERLREGLRKAFAGQES